MGVVGRVRSKSWSIFFDIAENSENYAGSSILRVVLAI